MFKEYLQSIPVSTEKLTTFLGDLTAENFQEYLSNAFDEEFVPDYPVIGLDYYDHMPIVVNLDEVHSIAIYGKKKFGKSNLLRLLVQSIRKEHPEYRFVYFDDGRKQLTQLYEGSNI